MSDRYGAYQQAVEAGIWHTMFKQRVVVVHWTFSQACSEPSNDGVVGLEGIPWRGWQRLQKPYKPYSVTSRANLVRSLFEISYQTREDPTHFISRLERANLKLLEHNRGVTDDNILKVFISQFPKPFRVDTDPLGSGLGCILEKEAVLCRVRQSIIESRGLSIVLWLRRRVEE